MNRQTVEDSRVGDVAAIVVPIERQHDPREVGHLVDRLMLGGVEVQRAEAPFERRGPAVRRGHVRHPDDAGVRALRQRPAREADVSGGAARAERGRAAVRRHRLVARHAVRRARRLRADAAAREAFGSRVVQEPPETPGGSSAAAARFAFAYAGPDTATAINRLLADGARVVDSRRLRALP